MTTFAVVAPHGASFPIDMLRHDRCWPARPEDSVTISASFNPTPPNGETLIVTLRGDTEPTLGRWASFGWRVKLVVDAG
jgi:hypothetical protein